MTKNTTPTNEAGHGLPEGIIERLAAAKDQLPRGSDERKAVWQAIEYLRTSGAGALSRGVPADMVLVPRELTTSMAEAAEQEFACGNDFSDAWEAAIATHIFDSGTAPAAPAAAGAQGEVEEKPCKVCGTPEYAWANQEDATCLSCHADATPQPAAADGGVRERARELLAQQFDSMNPLYADCIRKASPTDIDDSPHVDAALRAISAALSSHRQAGDDLSKFRELAERWQKELDRSGVSNDEYNYGFDVAKSGCLYELKSILALVEKGAG